MKRGATIGGVPFAVSDLERSTAQIIQSARAEGIPVRLANSYNVALASRDARYLELLEGVGINLPDGKPIVLMQRLLGNAGAQQVRGPSLFRSVLDRGREVGIRHFLLGCRDDYEMDLLKKAIGRSFPGATIAGALVPPFGDVDNYDFEGWSSSIANAEAEIVWVGLGSPKQDWVAARLAELTGKTAVGVGAAFAFVAGTQSEAPKLLQSVGLEWLFRLLTEPRRLWRRYAVGVGVYTALCARDLLKILYTKSLKRA